VQYVTKADDGQYKGWYVARPGSAKSYTRLLQDARIYDSREAANRDACGNEHVEER
jgi:hypothetical protein